MDEAVLYENAMDEMDYNGDYETLDVGQVQEPMTSGYVVSSAN